MTGDGVLVAHWPFGPDDREVRAARDRVMQQLADWGFDLKSASAQVCRLLTSELVTNSIRYSAGAHLGLVMRAAHGQVTVAVADPNPTVPTKRTGPSEASLLQAADGAYPVEDLAEGQRGMFLVEELADECGCQLDVEGGKSVWFTLTIPAAAQQVTTELAESAGAAFHREMDIRIRDMRPQPRIHHVLALVS